MNTDTRSDHCRFCWLTNHMERCKRTTKKKTKKKKVKKFTVEVNRSFHNKKSMSKRMSSHRNNVALNKEVLIQRWQHQLINRTHLNFQEFLHLLRQHVWIKFRISFRSLLFRFNIDETWSLVLFDFLFFFFLSFSAIVGDILLPIRSWFKRVPFWIWMDRIYIQSDRVCTYDLFIYFFLTNIWWFRHTYINWQDIQSYEIHSNTRTIHTCL